MMKLLLVLVGALGVARAAVTCDECKAFVQDLASYSQSTESIAEQVQLMKDKVCPQVRSPTTESPSSFPVARN